jgi:hypothetical protein
VASATTEVEGALNRHEQVDAAVVYGVQVPGTDGRAGMASLTGKSDAFDGPGLAAFLKAQLPAYAVPLFIRLRPEQVAPMSPMRQPPCVPVRLTVKGSVGAVLEVEGTIVAFLEDPVVVKGILTHLGLPAEPLPVVRARGPPPRLFEAS